MPTRRQRRPRRGKAPENTSSTATSPAAQQTSAAAASDEQRRRNDRIQETLVRTVIALPLIARLSKAQGPPDTAQAERDQANENIAVIIDAHLDFPKGRTKAREWIGATLLKLCAEGNCSIKPDFMDSGKNRNQPQYVFVSIPPAIIRKLVECDGLSNKDLALRGLPVKDIPGNWDASRPGPCAIYQIWEDFLIHPLICHSISTVKADAGRAAFKAAGEHIVWAVVDSGVDANHPHFALHRNLVDGVEAWHADFTDKNAPLSDDFGHGTHVAGIIAGEIVAKPDTDSHPDIVAYQRVLHADQDQDGREITIQRVKLDSISGMAPKTKIVSLRVLDERGQGQVSNIIAALAHIQEINAYGRRIRIHGVNLSVGYPFDPEWFACGQSQLCVEVDRLVRSGVVVVVAAGNTGYGTVATKALGAQQAGMVLTINDPGNAQLAVTVGSTHRTMPHVYGVSYFSAKGPTGDGRLKPDVLAPGEKVISCAAGQLKKELAEKLEANDPQPTYLEYSGTSMAAPHVAGCIASFLSVKREFIGQPDVVKNIFVKTATDLGRERSFQGAGLVDVMRAIQYV